MFLLCYFSGITINDDFFYNINDLNFTLDELRDGILRGNKKSSCFRGFNNKDPKFLYVQVYFLIFLHINFYLEINFSLIKNIKNIINSLFLEERPKILMRNWRRAYDSKKIGRFLEGKS